MNESPYSNPDMAAVYERIAARFQFAAPARDLVEVVGVTEGGIVLDVGSGTGVVTAAAQKATGATGIVVGADSSMEMVRLAGNATGFVLANACSLPFSSETFDCVIAGFVVSHFHSYLEGLTEMARVCRIGGRVGMSAWGAAANPAAALWNELAAQYAPREQLNDAFLKHIPWDIWFSSGDNVALALQGAGLDRVHTETRYYSVRMPTGDYLLSREASVQGLVLRRALTAAQWKHFTQQVTEVFQSRFGDVVEYSRDAHFGVGTKQ
jgi:SAM-dependent methyltransferase